MDKHVRTHARTHARSHNRTSFGTRYEYDAISDAATAQQDIDQIKTKKIRM